RPGVHVGSSPRAAEPRCGRAHRRGRGRAARALRQRAAGAASGREPDGAAGRLHEGRSMADDLTPTSSQFPDPALTKRPAPPPAVPPGRSPLYAHRFGLAYALLAVVVGLAVGGFIVLVGRATEPPG